MLSNELPYGRKTTEDEWKAVAGLSSVLVHFESRLPVRLERTFFSLKVGSWREPPPPHVGAHSVAVWSAVAGGLFGHRGVNGTVRYSCEWNNRSTHLILSFESAALGRSRQFTVHEEVSGPGLELLHIQCKNSADGDRGPSGVLGVAVELREQVAGHLVMHHRRRTILSTGAITLRGSRLAAMLNQAPRSALIRIVNLTRQDLVLDMDPSQVRHSGYWIKQPSQCLAAQSVADLGIAAAGFLSGVQGKVSYVLSAPHTSKEESISVCISWQSPWVGKRRVHAEDMGKYFVAKANVDDRYNLTGVVHILNPGQLPRLEVLSAIVFARQTAAREAEGTDLTEAVLQQMISPFELEISSVKNLLGGRVARSINVNIDTHSQLQISYRIGPEVFTRTFLPNDRVHLSSAVPGGFDDPATTLAAVEAVTSDAPSAAADPTLGHSERALLCQRILTGALSPVVHRALQNSEAWTFSEVREWHHWRQGGEGDAGISAQELDAEGLLRALRACWEQVATAGGVENGDDLPDRLLDPMEQLVSKWAEQAPLDDGTVKSALAAAVELLKCFQMDAESREVEFLNPPVAPDLAQSSPAKSVSFHLAMGARSTEPTGMYSTRSEQSEGRPQRLRGASDEGSLVV